MPRRSRHLAEPSIPPLLLLAIRIVGAKRLMKAQVRRRMELSGLDWDEIEPVIACVRTISDWASAFEGAADTAERGGDFGAGSAFAYLGQLPLSPYNPRKTRLREQFRRCHVKYRMCRPGLRFERLVLADGQIVAYRETPDMDGYADRPTILLMPPLASTKEELILLSDPLLDAGYQVIRIDLPGQGESPPPLCSDSEKLIARALDEIRPALTSGVVASGISLGAHYAFRLAALDPDKILGVAAVSPMAVQTEKQWTALPEIIYQYLDLYFDSPHRCQTQRLSRQMKIEPDIADRIICPVRIYHAANDALAQGDAPVVYRRLLRNAELTDRIVTDRHGCLLHLGEFGREIACWCKGLPAISAN